MTKCTLRTAKLPQMAVMNLFGTMKGNERSNPSSPQPAKRGAPYLLRRPPSPLGEGCRTFCAARRRHPSSAAVPPSWHGHTAHVPSPAGRTRHGAMGPSEPRPGRTLFGPTSLPARRAPAGEQKAVGSTQSAETARVQTPVGALTPFSPGRRTRRHPMRKPPPPVCRAFSTGKTAS